MMHSYYMTVVAIIFVAILSREVAVYRLRKRKIEDWEKYGRPEFMERDYFLQKYPYRGWVAVFGSSGIFDRAILLLFAASHVSLLVMVLIIIAKHTISAN